MTDHDLVAIQKKEIEKFQKIINDYPEFKRSLVIHFLRKTWNSNEKSPSVIKCSVTNQEDGKRLYSLQSVVIYEYSDFLPGLRDAINDTLSKNRIPVLMSINLDEDHEVAFPIAVEYD
ncbi:hypothetical protein [Dolichospermum phage Dfl-JY23]